ncbi:MAG TPA: AMP-binding protein, partial [Sphingomicrobium sp.]|nr:AMP-binding protein [Sphingomicrobium sp.]
MSDAPATLAELIGQQARRYQAKTALRDQGVDTSYAELDARSNQVARALQAGGVRPGNRIGYLGKNDSRYFEVLFGAAKAGAVLTPINWRLAELEVEWILGNAEIVCLFVAEQFLPMVRSIADRSDRPPTLVIIGSDGPGQYERWRYANSPDPVETDVSPGTVVVQLYTSGTTGRPKGAMLTHRNLLVLRAQPVDEQPDWNRFTDDDVSLIVMPIFHIGGTGFGLQTLAAGATGLIATEFDAGQILEFVENERLSKIFVVPSALQMLIRHPRARLVDYRRIRTILYGASPIPLALLREAIEVFRCGFVQMYGMTETSGTICALPPQDHDPSGNQRMQSAGSPLRYVELRIVDSKGTDLPQGKV